MVFHVAHNISYRLTRERKMANLSEIQDKISSTDPDVMEYCLVFTKECMKEEEDRGKTFETKAGGILAILGILTGLVIPVTARFDLSGKGISPLLFVIFLMFVLFLIKAVWYAIKVVRISKASKTYRFTPNAIYQFQNIDMLQIKRNIISRRISMYDKIVERNTEKALYLQRSHRNAAISVAICLVFGSALLFDTSMLPSCLVLPSWFVSPYFIIISLSITIPVCLFLDHILERKEKLFIK